MECEAMLAGATVVLACLAWAGEDAEAFVRVSPRDPRYFELTNGRPHIPIGLNVIHPRGAPDAEKGLAQLDHWMKALAESGAVEPRHTCPFKLYAKDNAGIILHEAIFAPFFAGAAGCGQRWHWDVYVAANNLW